MTSFPCDNVWKIKQVTIQRAWTSHNNLVWLLFNWRTNRFTSWLRPCLPVYALVWKTFKNNCPVFGLNIKRTPFIGFILRPLIRLFPSNVLCNVTRYTYESSTNHVIWSFIKSLLDSTSSVSSKIWLEFHKLLRYKRIE